MAIQINSSYTPHYLLLQAFTFLPALWKYYSSEKIKNKGKMVNSQ